MKVLAAALRPAPQAAYNRPIIHTTATKRRSNETANPRTGAEHHGRLPAPAVLHRDELVGAYESEEQAIREGAVRCGQEPFLVRRTGDDMPVLTAPALNMEIAPCP